MQTSRSSVGVLMRRIVIASVFMIGGFPLSAGAVVKNFMAVMNGGQEVPATTSNSFGVAFLTFDTQTNLLCYSISYSVADLSSAESDAHIHGPAVPGVDGVIIFPLAQVSSPKNGCVGPLNASHRMALRRGAPT